MNFIDVLAGLVFLGYAGIFLIAAIRLVQERQNAYVWIGLASWTTFIASSLFRRMFVLHYIWLDVVQVISGLICLAIVFRYWDIRITTKQTAKDKRQARETQAQAERLALVGRMATGITHDFNNVIGIINSYAALLKGEVNSREAQDDIEKIEQATQEAAGITQQLLGLTRPAVQPEEIYIRSVIDKTLGLLEGHIPENVSLRTRYSPHPVKVRIQSTVFSQVVMNLILNSIDAMDKGGKITIDIDTYEQHRQQYLSCRVEDTGQGMSKSTQDQIFDPFFTTKPLGKGNGLGLTTTYGLITNAGGHINVFSSEGKGTRIELLLPIVA